MIRGLDLFCGGGGATAGYMRGFRPGEVHMTGVDRYNMPRYIGDDFFIEDAIRLLAEEVSWVRSFDFIHASPPCQYFSRTRTFNLKAMPNRKDLLTPLLSLIEVHYADKIWIIENVPDAPLHSNEHQVLRLCGSSFPGHCGFETRRLLRRHRNFRLQGFVVPDLPCQHNGYRELGVYGSIGDEAPGGGEVARSMREANKLMQIEWMGWRELKEAIPPAYTEYITTHGLAEKLQKNPRHSPGKGVTGV